MNKLNRDYWSDRYLQNQTGWDLGQVSPPLKTYFDQLTDKNLKILIPGCGRGYEGIYLYENGFKNVHMADFSSVVIAEIKNNHPEFPVKQLHSTDFFELKGEYDLIIEQTLFCAIDPSLRQKYVQQASTKLRDTGKMVGLLFNREFEGGPPFGGKKEDYLQLFEAYFNKVEMETCYNSIAPRLGSEVFFIAEK